MTEHLISFIDLEQYLPDELRNLENSQTAIPAIAKDRKMLALIEQAVQEVPTSHDIYLGDGAKSIRISSGIHPSCINIPSLLDA